MKESPLKEFLYWSDDGDLFAIRVLDWKIVFIEQNHTGLDIWEKPFERGPESFKYSQWKAERAFLLVPAQAIVGQWLQTFKEFPIRQKPASFNLDRVMDQLSSQKQ